MSEPLQKRCPYCAETIQAAAVVCRFCGRDLEKLAIDPHAPARRIAGEQPGTFRCSRCGRQVAAHAEGCAFCRQKFPVAGGAPVEAPSAPAPAPNGMKILGGIILATTVGALLIALLIVLGGRSGGNRAVLGGPDRISAWVDCKTFVGRGLKAPSSAVYPASNDPGVTITQSGGRWIVVGFVDAENSFGAKLRQDFRCEMTYNGTTATIKRLVIGSNTLLDT